MKYLLASAIGFIGIFMISACQAGSETTLATSPEVPAEFIWMHADSVSGVQENMQGNYVFPLKLIGSPEPLPPFSDISPDEERASR